MLKDKKKMLIVVLLVVGSFTSGIFFNNYMTGLEYERLLAEIEELEEEVLLTTLTPVSCTASTTKDAFLGCENLYDLTIEGWEDNNYNCKDQWLEFDFGKEVLIELWFLKTMNIPDCLHKKTRLKILRLFLIMGLF